ncbi:MAG: iron-containing alcohol dehydrogenase [Lachnospiraceae bacterium]|nr:iron-containing alcohol dehydrogenase [Lachnospiraceae bacterium]
MENFTYYTPTKVLFGKDMENRTGECVREFGGSKVLMVYGGGSAVKSGLLDRIGSSLKEAGIPYVLLGGVQPNPRLSKVYEGIELGKKEGADFLLAVGGGSVIDTSKAIAYGIANPDIDVWDIYSSKFIPKKCAPIGTVLTIAAAGSEMSSSSVITNEKGWIKVGKSFDICRPKFSVMDPVLTYTLPPYQTASGLSDIMMHTMERYFHNKKAAEITDGITEALLKDVMASAKIVMKDPTDYDARAEIMWCGALSHNGLTNCGGTNGDWSVHQLEHELSGLYDVAHGAGLTAVWGSWARYVLDTNPKRFAQYAVRIMDVVPAEDQDDTEIAMAGIKATEDFFRSVGMPTSLTELGVHPTEEEFKTLSVKCTFNHTRTIGNDGIRSLDENDIERIYRMAL